jgi:hypothetical protein
MSTLSARQQHFEEIRKLLAYLSTEEQLRLISEISINLHKKISALSSETRKPVSPASIVKGKYAHVPTSSDRFAQRKQEKIETMSSIR